MGSGCLLSFLKIRHFQERLNNLKNKILMLHKSFAKESENDRGRRILNSTKIKNLLHMK